METIRIEETFDAAHRQVGYPGNCANIHGHTWKATIELRCESFHRDKLGMSIDFRDLKQIIKNMDHMFLVAEDDYFASSIDIGAYPIRGGPSVENVALHVRNKIIGLLHAEIGMTEGGNQVHIFVEIQETPKNVFSTEYLW